MNINELRQAPPQTKQYLDAQLLNIGPAKVVNTTRGQRNVQELQVVDRQGVDEKIAYWYDVDKPDFAMPPQQVGQWLRWVVKTKPNGQYLNISGYPEKQSTPPQAAPINAATQEIIDRHREPKRAAEQIMDHMAGPTTPTDSSTKYPDPPIPALQAQEEYKAKEREKVIGMCMCGHVNARLVNTPPTELLEDKAQFAALWQIAIRIVDGTGQVQEGPNF